MATNFELHECVIFAQTTKIGTHENKAIHSMNLFSHNVAGFIDTGHQALIGHQQLSDAVGLYGVFLHTRESRQFRWGKGHCSKSQNTKK